MVAVMLYFPSVRIRFGGMSNVLLFLSLLVMVFVIGRQMVKRDRSRRDRWTLDDAVRWLSKFGLLFLFLLTSFVALHFFNTTMTDVLASAAESRTLNQDCIFMGTFDTHDVWHMSSAISLALWVLVLLGIRLRIWRREQLRQRTETSVSQVALSVIASRAGRA